MVGCKPAPLPLSSEPFTSFCHTGKRDARASHSQWRYEFRVWRNRKCISPEHEKCRRHGWRSLYAIPETRSFLRGSRIFDLRTLLTLVAVADAEATAENGPLAGSSSETVVINSPPV